MSQARLLEWAGISFNKTEWYKISLAMKVSKVSYFRNYLLIMMHNLSDFGEKFMDRHQIIM